MYRKECELETVLIEGRTGGKGIVKTEKLLCAPEEMMGKGRAYTRRTLNPGASTGMYTHEGEMETMVTISGKAVYVVNGQEQHLEAGDMIAAQSGDTHGIAQEGTEPLVLIAQTFYAQTREQGVQRKA